MKIFLSVLSIMCIISASVVTDNCKNYFSLGANESAVADNNFKRKSFAQPLWFTHNPIIYNVTETYDFDTSAEPELYGNTQYTYQNPNMNLVTPLYTSSNGASAASFVNYSGYLAFAYDSSNIKQDLYPASSFFVWSNVISNGKAYFGLTESLQLPNNCEISSDTRSLNDTNYFLRLKDGSNPTIGNGLILYRSSTTGSFSNQWDGYHAIDNFADTGIRIAFDEDCYCQIAFIYEIYNHNNQVIFTKRKFYHVMGVYNFRTSSKTN